MLAFRGGRRGGREGERVSRGAAGLAVRIVCDPATSAGEGTREHASTPSLDRPPRPGPLRANATTIDRVGIA